VVLAASSPTLGQCPGSWMQVTATGLGDRYDGAMVYDSARGKIILFGGSVDGTSTTGDTWVFDPNTSIWTEVTPATSPPPRFYHRMVYDSARDRVVLFGGYDGNGLDDTWEYDPGANTWTESVVAAPSPRRFFAMAYDSVREVTVVHGGQDSALLNLSDTWEWNGTAWSFRTNTGPQARAFHAMAFDVARNKSVLFGGFDSAAGIFDDTWLWNGTTWTEVALTGTRPEGNFWHVMAYDSIRNVVVSTTGNQTISSDVRTYEWDGTVWSLGAIGGPPYRIASQVAFDSARGKTVIYGGYQYGAIFLSDMWEWSGPTDNSPINFTSEPGPVTVCAGTNASFSLDATGLAPITNQWRRNGVPLSNGGQISGATTPTLTITGATGANAGSYDCIVTNSCGAVPSDDAPLTIVTGGACSTCCKGDMNNDGQFNALDIQGFVDGLLNGQGCP